MNHQTEKEENKTWREIFEGRCFIKVTVSLPKAKFHSWNSPMFESDLLKQASLSHKKALPRDRWG